MTDKSKYGIPYNQQILHGKKGVEEQIERLDKAANAKPVSQTEVLIASIMNSYRSALGPHKEDDARVKMFHHLLLEYTKSIMEGCLEAIVESQVKDYSAMMVKGEGNNDG